MNLDEKIREALKEELDMVPIYDFQIFGISVFVWKNKGEKFFETTLVETYPYQPDGSVPLIFIKAGYLEVCIESKYLYKRMYYKDHGYYPMALEGE